MDFGGRKVVIKALVGSHNYNLNCETSDKDYKVFVAPTFDDLYSSNQFSKSYIGENEDYDVHDIRKVNNLWWKANVNFLEVLFSEETKSSTIITNESDFLLKKIFSHKNEIAKMNLPYLYNACIGMHITKKNQIDKGTQGTIQLVEKFGMDTKQCLHSFRILDFLVRFADTNFNDFKKAIWYDYTDQKRKFLLDLKNGCYSKEEYLKIVNDKLLFVEENVKELYMKEKPNQEINNELSFWVKRIVMWELNS